MSPAHRKLLSLSLAVTLWMTTFPLAEDVDSQQNTLQLPPSSATKESLYFPPGTLNNLNTFFSSYLQSVREPSLLAASQDRSLVSYRLNWLGGQTGRMLSVRLSLNADGTAKVFTTEESGTPRKLSKTENGVAAADVRRFLNRVEKADFWSMPTLEAEESSPGPKPYKMDASPWVFEGVRNGHYHVVMRSSPESSVFTEMVGFLAKQIAKLDDSSVPHALPRTSSRR